MHFLVNHLPVAGILSTTVLLAVATARRTLQGAMYGYAGVVAVGLLAIVAYVSGNFAPPAVVHMAGVSPARINAHQVVTAIAMIAAVLGAVLAAPPLILTGIATKRGVLIA